MDELGMGLIWMVVDFISALSFFVSMAELALKRKNKNQGFFQVAGVNWWVVVLGLGWWWVDEKEGKTERWRTEMKREERRERGFFILFYCVIYMILICCMKK